MIFVYQILSKKQYHILSQYFVQIICMKANLSQSQSTVFNSIFDEESLGESTLNKKAEIYCIKQKLSQHACMNRNCKKYAFVCQDQVEHEGCFITKTSSILKAINKKIIPIKPLEDNLNQLIDELIDDLSTFRDHIIVQSKKMFQFIGLNSAQFYILTSIRDGDVSEIKGQDIWRSNLSDQQAKSQIINEMKAFNIRVNQKVKKLSQVKIPIETEIQNFCQFKKTVIPKNEQLVIARKTIAPIQNVLKSMYFQNSNILNQFEEIGTIIGFFEPRQLSNTHLLYRASENDFCTKKFHIKCQNTKNTIVLCQTKSGKKIGGFSPLQWGYYKPKPDKQFTAVYYVDQTGQSFLFSLTHKDKFRLKEDKKAILWWKQESKIGPSFGGGYDLIIHDKANQNFDSYSFLNSTYINESYNLQGMKKNYKRFIGDVPKDQEIQQNHFSLTEWQVWQVEFKA